MTPSATSRKRPTLSARAPVFIRTGTRPATASDASRSVARSGSAPAIGPAIEHGVQERRRDRAAGTVRDRSGAKRAREFGRDVPEHEHVVGVDRVPVAQELAGIRRPEPHVALVRARHDLAHEGGSRGARQRHRGERVPEDVDAERPVPRPQLGDDGRHRGGDLRADAQPIGPVVLVAEHHRVHTPGEEVVEIGPHPCDELVEARARYVARRARQRRQVRHGDDRLRGREEVGEGGAGRHGLPSGLLDAGGA